MFGTIRKHQSWLWMLIITLTIVSFVVFFSPGQRSNNYATRQNFGTLYGRPITHEQVMAARRAAEVADRLRPRNRRGGNINEETFDFILMDDKVKELGIVVGDDAVGAAIRDALKDPTTGAFDYNAVMQNFTQQTGVSEADFIEHIRGELARKQLIQVVSAASLFVTPREAESEFRRENEAVTTSAVFFMGDEYKSAVALAPEKISGFYSNRVAQYRIPERTVLNYVVFAIGKHLDEAKAEFVKQGAAITNRFEQVYSQNGPDAFRGKDDKVLSKEAAFARFKEDTLEKFGLSFAHKDAVAFYSSLNEKRTNALTPEVFQQLAVSKGLVVETTKPFSSADKIDGLEDVTQLAAKAASLTRQIPYTEPLIGSSIVIVPFLKAKLPSEIPAFETIKDRVTADYREDEAIRSATAAAQAFQSALTNTAAGAKSFEDLARERNRTIHPLPAVTAAMQTVDGLDPRIDAYSLKGRVLGLKTGESALIRLREGAAVVKVTNRKQPDDAIVKAAINGFTAELRQQRQYQAFVEWFDAEKVRSGLAAQSQKQDVGAE